MRIRAVADDEWGIVGWLWQAYRSDMSPIVQGLPYADGRFAHGPLDRYPAPDRAGYLGWSPHPNTGEEAPVALALVSGLGAARRTIDAFWVAVPARRGGAGRELATYLIARHDGPWEVAFQHDNAGAGHFWRAVATQAWGADWVETEEPVPGRPDLPPDHWIRTSPGSPRRAMSP